ncbi:MAG: hypothetical protein RL227_2393, partial [Pseudomonadota bacterium]
MIDRRQLLAGSAAGVALVSTTGALSAPAAPTATRMPKTITQLGRTRTDEYQWLKDEQWQEVLRDPAV